MKIVHLVNPFHTEIGSQDYVAQRLTLASMVSARNNFRRNGEICLVATFFEDEILDIPIEFHLAPFLSQSVKNIKGFSSKKKLPFIAEIFDKFNFFQADYIIYTNVDIALKPEFYNFIFDELQNGFDALIINRRRIPYHNYSPMDLPKLYNLKGKTHPGFDCFVIKNGLQKKFVLDNICVGIPFIEAAVMHNILAFAETPRLYPYEDLTFHLGMEIFKPRDQELYWHNRNIFFKKIKPKLWPSLDIRKFPYFEKGFPLRYWHWGLNPALFTLLNLKLDLRRLGVFLD
jgi:hypothetical protein